MTERSPEELEALVAQVESWASAVDPRDLREVPVEDLRAITSLVATMEEVERTLAGAIDRARHDGYSWSQIGTALGVSKQAAQQRYGSLVSG